MPLRLAVTAVLLALTLVAAGCDDCDDSPPPPPNQVVPLLPNNLSFWNNPDNWPTEYGPAFADIVVTPSNFVPCLGGPYALCYYSGPEPLPCVPTSDGLFANCECEEIAYGPYFVLITGILNYEVYQETIDVCGSDGSLCTNTTNMAPVCQRINEGAFLPGAELISTFSFACLPENGIGQTPCEGVYAGCMTAACTRTGEEGIVTCQCPTVDAPFFVGNFDVPCDIPSPLVYSAAYAPNGMLTAPMPPTCVPDAPGDVGCPLLDSSTVLPPGIDCNRVCQEYNDCQTDGVQVGYTCDATLCTSDCDDQDLVSEACTGLTQCDVTEIIRLEALAECSCCASQLCGCEPTAATNSAIAELNEAQEQRGITPQCQINGTLCGTE